jgi:hypothetical protein
MVPRQTRSAAEAVRENIAIALIPTTAGVRMRNLRAFFHGIAHTSLLLEKIKSQNLYKNRILFINRLCVNEGTNPGLRYAASGLRD